MMKTIKNSLKSNLYLYHYYCCLKDFKLNMIYNNLCKGFSNIDIFPDIEKYCQYVNEVKKAIEEQGKVFGISGYGGSESLNYGHIHAIFNYVGIKKREYRFYFPSIEHAARFNEDFYADYQQHWNKRYLNKKYHNYLFMSEISKNFIHSINPLKPVFCTGPYIHYATSFINQADLKLIKKKNGKTLVVFPTHGTELIYSQYSVKEFVFNIMNLYSKSYNTIIICAYWNDIDKPVYKVFKEEGAQIASAGFRGDFNFINRLKSIILLADDVVGNDVGTQIGYCMHMKKPYAIIPQDIECLKKGVGNYRPSSEVIASFGKAFSSLSPNDYEKKLQEKLYRKFWGGDELIKSKDEVQAMIAISQDVLNKSKGNVRQFNSIVLGLLQEYNKERNEFESLKLKMLRSALPQ